MQILVHGGYFEAETHRVTFKEFKHSTKFTVHVCFKQLAYIRLILDANEERIVLQDF
jgi:hypothetical protein